MEKYNTESRIGKIVKPQKLSWLTDEKIKEYLKGQRWENLENSVIDGHVWTQYLSKYDYKNVYLRDVENSPSKIIKQIIEQLNSSKK